MYVFSQPSSIPLQLLRFTNSITWIHIIGEISYYIFPFYWDFLYQCFYHGILLLHSYIIIYCPTASLCGLVLTYHVTYFKIYGKVTFCDLLILSLSCHQDILCIILQNRNTL